MSTRNKQNSKSEDKSKTLATVEVQQALSAWYDLRFNQITGVVEGRKKNEDVFKELNENNLYIQLLSNGYRVSLVSVLIFFDGFKMATLLRTSFKSVAM